MQITFEYEYDDAQQLAITHLDRRNKDAEIECCYSTDPTFNVLDQDTVEVNMNGNALTLTRKAQSIIPAHFTNPPAPNEETIGILCVLATVASYGSNDKNRPNYTELMTDLEKDYSHYSAFKYYEKATELGLIRNIEKAHHRHTKYILTDKGRLYIEAAKSMGLQVEKKEDIDYYHITVSHKYVVEKDKK